MAASYFTISLSPNIEESNDGSLICRDAVLGRTGWQTYRVGDLPQESAEELGIDLSDPDAEIDLYRPAEEVFHPDTLASIEGKTVTDDHPQSEDGNVNPDNFKQFACGHVQNVRRGKEPLESGDYPILGDVHIKAEPLLSDVRNHIKRELSLGYDYQIKRNGKRVDMHHITVNHCAVVPRGRAGREARINDSELPAKKGVASRGQTAIINKAGERKPVKLTWKHIFGAGIKAHAADAEPEELAEATMDAMEKHMRHEDDEMDARDSRAKDRKARDKHEDDRRGRDRHADDRKRDRVHDALDCLMDGRAKDTDLDELRDLLDEFFEEEKEEPEHEEDRGRDRRGRDKRGRDSRKARDKRADDGDGAEEEAEQTPKIEVEHLRKALSKDEKRHEDDSEDEHEDEHEHEEESHEDDSTHEHDAEEDQNEPISEDWKEDEPEDDQFEEDRARDKRGRDKARDRGRAHDGALAVLKTFRPFVARSQDKALRAAYDAALKEVAKASKPRSAGYGDFAARARAHDSSPRVSSEVKQAQELDSIFEKARTEGRK